MLTTIVGVSLAYVCLELSTRILGLPDKELVEYMTDELKHRRVLDDHQTDVMPLYGWDQPPIVMRPDGKLGQGFSNYKLLFVGDSVTRGYGVDTETESYPSLLFRSLSVSHWVEITNAAVQGFGIDQMVLKLEEILQEDPPDLVVLAYIPHDLKRTGRNINYGVTKPILFDFEEDKWRIVPAQPMQEYYNDYVNAVSRFYAGPWAAHHLVTNSRYYFPFLYWRYYEGLFRTIRNRLVKLAELYDTRVTVVRLASTWPGYFVPELDHLASLAFELPSTSGRYRFLDIENCTRSRAGSVEIDYTEAFKGHPGINGHEIYADCLLEHLLEEIPRG